MGFSRQEYWSGLSFPSPGDLQYAKFNQMKDKKNQFHLTVWLPLFIPCFNLSTKYLKPFYFRYSQYSDSVQAERWSAFLEWNDQEIQWHRDLSESQARDFSQYNTSFYKKIYFSILSFQLKELSLRFLKSLTPRMTSEWRLESILPDFHSGASSFYIIQIGR